jgi:hypothetical protein
MSSQALRPLFDTEDEIDAVAGLAGWRPMAAA